MRRTAGLCTAAAVLALAAGCGKKSSTSADSGGGGGGGGTSVRGIEGTYVVVGMEIGGEVMPEAKLAQDPESERTVKITADKFIGSNKKKDEPSTYKIDTSKKPFQIDLTEKQPDGTDVKIYGIYKIEGDKLTICISMSEKAADRPKEFKTAVGAQAMMMTLKKK